VPLGLPFVNALDPNNNKSVEVDHSDGTEVIDNFLSMLFQIKLFPPLTAVPLVAKYAISPAVPELTVPDPPPPPPALVTETPVIDEVFPSPPVPAAVFDELDPVPASSL